MCDYSLMSIPNRLAVEGEDLVTYRFHSGSIGFASEADVRRAAGSDEPTKRGFWSSLRNSTNLLMAEPVCAVCVPPGARLLLQDISEDLQRNLNTAACEEVTFVELGMEAYTYRDAVRFANGREIRLQDLRPGQQARVLRFSSEQTDEAVRYERSGVSVR